MKDDFTPQGMRLAGPWENDRNAEHADLFKDIIREAFGVTDVIVAHHLVYVVTEKRDGFDYTIVEEIPSADSLIFDHDIAKKLWGAERYKEVLAALAVEPVETRDDLLRKLYYGRSKVESWAPSFEEEKAMGYNPFKPEAA